MIKVIFTLNENNTIIECNIKENIERIIEKFTIKVGIDIRKNDFFYKGMNINDVKLTLEEIIIEKDKINNEINIIVKKKDENKIKEIIEYDKKANHIFKKNPNFKYKLTITNTNDPYGYNDIFEVFFCYKDKKEYIISPNYENYNLDIYTLIDNKKIRSLKCHEDKISTVKYFINKKDCSEYFISIDKSLVSIVWDITNDFQIKKRFTHEYLGIIYINLLIFSKNDCEEKIKLINTKKFVQSESYILCWYNKNNNNFYAIQLSNNLVAMINLFEKEERYYLMKKPEDYHLSGFIYTENNNDYLCCSSTNGYINIWDLFKKKIFKRIYIEACYLLHIIPWNEKYLIVADYYDCSFKVVNYQNVKVISDIGGQHKKKVICVKKIFHPIYGESLLSASEDNTIKLWTI